MHPHSIGIASRSGGHGCKALRCCIWLQQTSFGPDIAQCAQCNHCSMAIMSFVGFQLHLLSSSATVPPGWWRILQPGLPAGCCPQEASLSLTEAACRSFLDGQHLYDSDDQSALLLSHATSRSTARCEGYMCIPTARPSSCLLHAARLAWTQVPTEASKMRQCLDPHNALWPLRSA